MSLSSFFLRLFGARVTFLFVIFYILYSKFHVIEAQEMQKTTVYDRQGRSKTQNKEKKTDQENMQK